MMSEPLTFCDAQKNWLDGRSEMMVTTLSARSVSDAIEREIVLGRSATNAPTSGWKTRGAQGVGVGVGEGAGED